MGFFYFCSFRASYYQKIYDEESFKRLKRLKIKRNEEIKEKEILDISSYYGRADKYPS